MVQTFILGILLFFQSVFAPLIYDIPTGPVDYGGGFAFEETQIGNPLYIFKDGETDYFLVTPDAPSPTIESGVKWIQDFIGRMTGKTFARKTASQVLPGDKYIAVGLPALGGFAAEAAALGDEDYIKRAVGGNVFISGSGNGRGTMYGCASFIEDELGCRWFTPALKLAPAKEDIFIDAALDDTQTALLDYRDDYWPYVCYDPEFKAFHKLNSFMGARIGAEYGSNTDYIGGFCHTMHDLVPRGLFAQNEKLFAYRKDKKAWVPDQRCLTNEAVYEMVRDKVFAYIEANKDNPNARIVSVTQEDNDAYCQCPNCEAMDALYGGPSGTNIWFTNRIARAVWDKFPGRRDILVDTFAYTYTLPPPKNIVPEGNVIVRMCSIGCCFNHPIRDCGHGRGADGIFADMKPHESGFAKYLVEWGKLCAVNGAQIYVWDYTTCFEFYPAIYPNLHVLADNLQLFVENGVRGVFEQGYDTGGVDPLPGSVSGEFGELRAYMLAKLLWDPYLNSNQLMAEFMDAYYGAASAPYIREFLDYYTNKAIATNHLGVFGRPEAFTYMNNFECKKMEKLFDKAEELAGDREQLLNVKRTRLCLRLYKANLMLGEFSWFNPCRLRNNKALFYDCVLLGVDRFSAVMVEPYNTYVWLHRPYDWAKMKSWIDFVDESKLVPMDLAAYRAAHGGP